MAVRNKTTFIPNSIYFITFTISEWQNVFTEDKYINLAYKWFDYAKEKYKNKIHAYVIMPNHIHILIYISDLSPAISKLIQNAKRFMAYGLVQLLQQDGRVELLELFSRGANHKKGARHKIFKEKYDSKIIENERIFIEKLNYIHNNPCTKKWCLTDKPENYKYSSASNYILGKGIYEVDFVE